MSNWDIYLFHLIITCQFCSIYYGISRNIWTKSSPQGTHSFLNFVIFGDFSKNNLIKKVELVGAQYRPV